MKRTSFTTNVERKLNLDHNFFKEQLAFNTGVTDPSLIVKISESDKDWDVSPPLRKTAPFSSKSLSILSYNFDLNSDFDTEESDRRNQERDILYFIYLAKLNPSKIEHSYINASSNMRIFGWHDTWLQQAQKLRKVGKYKAVLLVFLVM